MINLFFETINSQSDLVLETNSVITVCSANRNVSETTKPEPWAEPTQSRPPPLGAGFVQVRDWFPPPHVTELTIVSELDAPTWYGRAEKIRPLDSRQGNTDDHPADSL